MSIDPIDALYGALRTVPDFPEPGVQFKDISPILADPALLRSAVRALSAPYADMGVTKVIGVESRGFLFGTSMADWLGAGFVLARKPGKLPAATLREDYTLEYGTDSVEIHADAVGPDDRVLIHDDVIATGGTAAATARLVERAGAEVVGFAFLIELEFLKGRAQLPDGLPVHVVLDV